MPDEEIVQGWLDKDGICMFTGSSSRIPSSMRIASPDIGFLDLLSGLIIKNPKGKGVVTVDYNSIQDAGKPLPDKILGIVLDMDIMGPLLEEPDGILVQDSNGLTDMTLAQWKEKFGTDAFPLFARARLFNLKSGGGVVTHPTAKPSGKEPVKLGSGGRTSIRG